MKALIQTGYSGRAPVPQEKRFLITICLLIASLVVSRPTAADASGIDPDHAYAWAPNVGWVNVMPEGQTIRVHFNGEEGWLQGFAWSENVGWINFGSHAGGPYANNSATNWGVNLAASGSLAGYAWGENIGWINFDHAYCTAALDMSSGDFSGHAWGENIGWLSFGSTSMIFRLRTQAFDPAPNGTPSWWLVHHDVDEAYDTGDGVPAWQKYVMDTDPHAYGDALKIESVTTTALGHTEVVFTPASPRRYYTLLRASSLTTPIDWSPVQTHVAGQGSSQIITDAGDGPRAYYKVIVRVTL